MFKRNGIPITDITNGIASYNGIPTEDTISANIKRANHELDKAWSQLQEYKNKQLNCSPNGWRA